MSKESPDAGLDRLHQDSSEVTSDATATPLLSADDPFGLSALAALPRAEAEEPRRLTREALVRIAEAPVLKVDELSSPVTIASMELLRNGRNFVVRVRSTSGDEGLAVPNAMRLIDSYPIFLRAGVAAVLRRQGCPAARTAPLGTVPP